MGVRAQIPILLGVVPFGLIFGALAISQGIPAWVTMGLSLFVFAGSAQFVAAGMLASAAPAAVIVATILVINLRHVLYSASLAPRLRRLPLRWRAPLAWLLTDEAFATTSTHFQTGHERAGHWYMLGSGLTLWASWQVSTAFGVFVGAQVPSNWSLEFALPLTFLALLTPTLIDRPTVLAAVTAGVTAVGLAWLPFKLGLLAASLLGIGMGLALERYARPQGNPGA